MVLSIPASHRPIPGPARAAALLVAVLAIWAVQIQIAAGVELSLGGSLRVLATAAFGLLMIWIGVSGRDLPARLLPGRLSVATPVWPVPEPVEPASPEQRLALERLGDTVPPGMSSDDARRRLHWLEARLPASLEQQRALSAYGRVRGVYTRAAATRFLAQMAAIEDEQRAEDWAEAWQASGGPVMVYPAVVEQSKRAAFDAAVAALGQDGLAWPHLPVLGPYDVEPETARMRRAASFLADFAELQAVFLADGELRRLVEPGSLRRVFADYALLVMHAPELLESSEVCLGLLQKAQPGVLGAAANGFALAADLRDALDRCAALREQEVRESAQWLEDDDGDESEA